MATLTEFEKLLESNISQLNMTPGEIIPAKVIDIKNDFVMQAQVLNQKELFQTTVRILMVSLKSL